VGAIKFQQSSNDFPLTVALGEKSPAFGLSRWANNAALRFIPPDDEGYSMRGDKRRLVYKGRERSHRFTILGDNSFEYDCILLREPKSNVITLRMEGAENYDFFRQPDFVPDLFLKGSYAVYKKETLLGEGTGKLCHIHRPEIIDARGRRCWGELSVMGNTLCITVPEKWLAEAAYPVVVDPTIGTTTIGSQIRYRNEDNELERLFFEVSMGVNRFLIPETLNGMATAYVYAFDTDYWGRCKPVLYSDNNNVPQIRRSTNEGTFDIEVRSGKPASWRSANFNTNSSIASGTNIWFGLFCDWFAPRFDFGQKCYWDFWDLHGGTDIPNTYPVWSVNWFYDFKLSMYFTYTSAQNYVRVLTQGVRITDNRILKTDYKRTAVQSVRASTTTKGFFTYIRKLQEAVQGTDKNYYIVLFSRTVRETASTSGITGFLGSFIRGVFDNAEIESDVKMGRVYTRLLIDTVRAASTVLRGLFLFVSIITRVFTRDYLLNRFLKARQELVLKSCVSREIILESRIG